MKFFIYRELIEHASVRHNKKLPDPIFYFEFFDYDCDTDSPNYYYVNYNRSAHGHYWRRRICFGAPGPAPSEGKNRRYYSPCPFHGHA